MYHHKEGERALEVARLEAGALLLGAMIILRDSKKRLGLISLSSHHLAGYFEDVLNKPSALASRGS